MPTETWKHIHVLGEWVGDVGVGRLRLWTVGAEIHPMSTYSFRLSCLVQIQDNTHCWQLLTFTVVLLLFFSPQAVSLQCGHMCAACVTLTKANTCINQLNLPEYPTEDIGESSKMSL